MVKLNFSFLGYVYQSGVRSLRDSFVAASQGIGAKIGDAERALVDHRRYIAQGGKWIGEYDDASGVVIWDQEDILEYDLLAGHGSGEDLRKTFCIAAYHHWERFMRMQSKDPRAKHPVLVAYAIEKGFPISPEMPKAHRLANALKHNSDSHGSKLRECWPTIVKQRLNLGKNADWYDLIVPTEADVHIVFDIIANSGPRTTLP